MSPTVTNIYFEKVLPQTWDAKTTMMQMHPKQLLDMLRHTYRDHNANSLAARESIKEVLDTKPHVPTKKERKADRIKKANSRK